MSFRLLFATIFFSIASCASSRADCVYKPFQFFPDKNDGVIVGSVVEKGASCQHKFKEGKGYRFTSVEIDGEQPPHGQLTKIGDAEFVYTPAPDFVGDDMYAFKICATKGKKKGCSFVAFEAHVRALAAKSDGEAKKSADCGSGPPERVIPACAKAIDDAQTSPADRVKALKWRGVAYFRKGDLEHAVADFSKATELDPKDADSFNNLGLARQWRGEFDQAIASYDRAIDLEPKQYATYVNRSNLLRLKGDVARALADANVALELAPRFSGGYKARGWALQANKDLDGAVRDMTRAIELAPNDDEAILSRGNIYRLKGDSQKAFADFDRAAKAAPKKPDAYVNRGAALLSRGEYDRALADFETAMRLGPKEPNVVNNHGVALLHMGEYDRALADFDEALKLDPKKIDILANRGFANFGKADFAAASADFQRLAEANPKHPYAALWRYMARGRAGEADKSLLAAAPKNMAEWPAPVVSYLAGGTKREALDSAAKQGDEQTQKARACEIAFYLGEQALIEKRTDDAKTLLRQAAETCPADFLEHAGTLGERRRLAR